VIGKKLMNTTSQPATGQPVSTPQVIQGEALPVVSTQQVDTADALHILTCLLVGGGLEAADLLMEHARAWQARFATTPRLLPVAGEQDSTDVLRHALIGFIFDGEERLRQNLSWWGEQLMHTAGMAAAVTRPVTDSWLMAPLRQPLRSLSQQTQAEMARLIHRGRIEEAISRVMTTELTDEMVSVILAYLSDKPEVRRLIREQGMSMGEEIVDEVRNQSATVDATVESIVRRLLNRAPRPPSPPPVSVT
jgi:hypothetical protein